MKWLEGIYKVRNSLAHRLGKVEMIDVKASAAPLDSAEDSDTLKAVWLRLKATADGHDIVNFPHEVKKKYSPVFQSCLTSTDHPDTSPFSFVVAFGKDGRVLRLYTDHETNIFACVRKTLQQDEFPHPPLSPYYMHISMSFPK
jgi:hypothetical protein